MGVLENPRHEAFCQNRAKGMSRDAAYVGAGFRRNRSNAARLNANERILARIAELTARGAAKAEVSIESLIEQMRLSAYGDARALFDEDGRLLPIHRMSREAAALIAGFEVTETAGDDGARVKVSKVRLRNVDKAQEMLARHLGLFVDRLEVTNKDTRSDDDIMRDIDRRLQALARLSPQAGGDVGLVERLKDAMH